MYMTIPTRIIGEANLEFFSFLTISSGNSYIQFKFGIYYMYIKKKVPSHLLDMGKI